MTLKEILNRKLSHDVRELKEYDTFKSIIKLFVKNVKFYESTNCFIHQWLYLPELGKIIRNEFAKEDVKAYKSRIIKKYFYEIDSRHYEKKEPNKSMFF